MSLTKSRIASAVAAATLLLAGLAAAQNPLGTRVDWIGDPGIEELWNEGDLGNGEGSNWADVGFGNNQPLGSENEYASISLPGAAGRAVIDSQIGISPTDIILGEDPGSAGTLIIRDGGEITVQANGGTGNGELRVGTVGTGNVGLEDDMGTVTVQRYTQGANSLLVARLSGTGTFSEHIDASESIGIGGRLLVEQLAGTDFTLTTGDSWTLIEGAPVTGSFNVIDVQEQLLGNPGQTIEVSTDNNAVTISVGQRLVLNVDQFTGGAVLTNPEGHSIDIELIDYILSSAANNLNGADARWKSFADDPSKAGWFEANPTSSNLSELNDTSASLVFFSGDSHDFGTPFNVNTAAPLGEARLDTSGVSFTYLDPDTGQQISAGINVVGRINDLVLVVDPATGEATIQNQSAQPVEFISYTITSPSASLLATYDGIEGGNGPTWFFANPTSENLSELSLGSPADVDPGDEFELGVAWDAVNGEQDLAFLYQDPISGELVDGTVFFGEKFVFTAVQGDYNGDGVVDAADYTVWRNHVGGDGAAFPTGTRDGSNSGPINAADYAFWKANFGNEGAAGTADYSATGVPEPASCTLLAIAGLAVVFAVRNPDRFEARRIDCRR